MAAALLVMSYASAFVNPAKAWYMMLPGLFFFPFALLNVFLLVWAIGVSVWRILPTARMKTGRY